MKIFLSVGATYTPEQDEFITSFESFLNQNGCQLLTVGRNQPPTLQPIIEVRDRMKQADGVIVIAFTRIRIEKAIEKPGGSGEKSIANINVPTIWNQMEAAMAYGLHLPFLLIMEEGLHEEAMIKDRHEYSAIKTKLHKSYFATSKFQRIFDHWKNNALAKPKSIETKVDVDSLTIESLYKALTPKQFKNIVVAFFSILSAVAIAGYWFGKKFG